MELSFCRKVGQFMAVHGWILHTGAAQGADQSFAMGAFRAGGRVMLHLPWATYEREWITQMRKHFAHCIRTQVVDDCAQYEKALDSVEAFHPRGAHLGRGPRMLHARNYTILSPEPNQFVRFVLAFPENGSGGTMQGVRIADTLSVPVIRADQLTPEEAKSAVVHVVRGDAPADTTLADAQATVAKALREPSEGIDCPCCGQKVQLYRRPLNSEMARWLIVLTRLHLAADRGWVNVKDGPLKATRGGDYGKLLHWGLIEQRPNTDPKKRTSGFWRPTQKGVQFAKNELSVPSHVYIYNNQARGFSDTAVTIVDALGVKFSYPELLQMPLEDR